MNNRRDFLKNLARLGLAGGIVGGTIHRIRHNPVLDPADHVCVGTGICRGCKAFQGCGLPQALSAKAVMKKNTPQETDKVS